MKGLSMPATHMRITADIPLTKERKFGAVHKALNTALVAWQTAVEAEGGAVEFDAVTIAKRKPVAEVPANPIAPTVDLAAFAELGTSVAEAAKEPEPLPVVGGPRGRHAA